MMTESNTLKEITAELDLTEEEESIFLDIVIATHDKKYEERESLIQKACHGFPKTRDAVRKWAMYLVGITNPA